MKSRFYFFLFFFLSFTFLGAAITEIHLTDKDGNPINLVYDDTSYSYYDAGENPNVYLKICASPISDIQDKYVLLVYSNGNNGDVLRLGNLPQKIVPEVTNSTCAFFDLHYSGFLAVFPGIPTILLADNPSMSGAERYKLSERMLGDFEISVTDLDTSVSITIDAIHKDSGTFNSDEGSADRALVSIVRSDGTVVDSGITHLGGSVILDKNGVTEDMDIYINGIQVNASVSGSPGGGGGTGGGGGAGGGGGGGRPVTSQPPIEITYKDVGEGKAVVISSALFLEEKKENDVCDEIEGDKDLVSYLQSWNVWCPGTEGNLICKDTERFSNKVKKVWEYKKDESGEHLILHVYPLDDFTNVIVKSRIVGNKTNVISNRDYVVYGDYILIKSTGKKEISITFDVSGLNLDLDNPFVSLPPTSVYLTKGIPCVFETGDFILKINPVKDRYYLGEEGDGRLSIINKLDKEISGKIYVYSLGQVVLEKRVLIPKKDSLTLGFSFPTFICSEDPEDYPQIATGGLLLRAVFVSPEISSSASSLISLRYPKYLLDSKLSGGNLILCSFVRAEEYVDLKEKIEFIKNNQTKKEEEKPLLGKKLLLKKEYVRNEDNFVFIDKYPVFGMETGNYLIKGRLLKEGKSIAESHTTQEISAEALCPSFLLPVGVLILVLLLGGGTFWWFRLRKRGRYK